MSCISSEEINGALPPGTYIPTESIDLNSFHTCIPFVVSIGVLVNLFYHSHKQV